MRTYLRSYLIWVLLPVGMASLGVFHFAAEEPKNQDSASLHRMAGVARFLLREEMGKRAGEIAESAPLLESPDPGTPVLQAALRGDTVAALGLAGPDLVLSVALAIPGDQGATQVKAMTQPFQPTSLTRFQGRTGLSAALFLRRAVVASAPPGFTPTVLQASGSGALVPSEPQGQLLLPLAPTGEGPPPVQILIEARAGGEGGGRLLPPILILLLPLLSAIGCVLFLTQSSGWADTRKGAFPLLALACLPWGALVALSLGAQRGNQTRGDEVLGRDLMQSVALLQDGSRGAEWERLSEESGFEVIQRGPESSVFATFENETLRQIALSEPPPPSDVPTQGEIESEGERWAYAASSTGPSTFLMLLAREEPAGVRRVALLLLGVAGLSGLAFTASRPGSREAT